MMNAELVETEEELHFYQDVHAILDEAKSKTYEAANNIMTHMHIGMSEKGLLSRNKRVTEKQSTVHIL